jgi:prepilin signal peptidase PulO-like enzyme (type II secretory pathway)
MDHRPILAAALVFTLLLAGLTLTVLIRTGPDVLTLFSLLVLGLFGFGIIGALREPPED